MSQETGKIEGTVEAWESGLLGTNPAHMKVAPPEINKMVDDALGMQAISIRLDKELIECYKMLAKIHGMAYQPLMREVLKRFAECETKTILQQMAQAEHKEHLENGKQRMEVEIKPAFDQKRAA